MQNQILFLKEFNRLFDEGHVYDCLSEREIIDEEGNKISEWSVTINDIEDFMKTL
ncbi:hypothetical protein [Myxosarcina sp. GI1]|uniref:hypothetical protein n=1 Tax=Myxosarcina sp. GI1 TaxID=1541065 RepID=UPI00155A348F